MVRNPRSSTGPDGSNFSRSGTPLHAEVGSEQWEKEREQFFRNNPDLVENLDTSSSPFQLDPVESEDKEIKMMYKDELQHQDTSISRFQPEPAESEDDEIKMGLCNNEPQHQKVEKASFKIQKIEDSNYEALAMNTLAESATNRPILVVQPVMSGPRVKPLEQPQGQDDRERQNAALQLQEAALEAQLDALEAQLDALQLEDSSRS